MTNILYAIRRFLAVMLVGIMFFGVSKNGAEPHAVLDEESCRLSAFIASDAHIEGNQYGKFKNFSRMLYDIKNGTTENDAVVFLGDNTMNGQNIENMFFFGALSKVSPAKNMIVALGNHDVGNGEGNYNELIERYLAYNNMFFNAGISKPYFYKVINGYYFIMLGTEASTSNEMAVTQEQLDFLRATMDLATAEGKPVFVFNHHPVNREEGEYVYSIINILESYRNVFYIYGHTHWPLYSHTMQVYDKVHMLNVPMFTSINPEDTTGEDTGVAFALEVYDDSVVFRARDCYDGKWLENYTYTIPIEK